MEELKHDLYIFATKIWTVLVWIFLGLIGKFSMDIMTGKKITFLQAFASTGTALFVGVVSHLLCIYFNIEKQSMFIVPMATLLSDKIMIALFAMDWTKVIHDWFAWWSDFTNKK